MATDNIERLHYYQRQYLGALDFEDEQAYLRDMRRRLNLAHHTWGIVSGLELAVGANGVDINITPGMAIDGYGREIVMFQPMQLDPALFRLFRNKAYFTVCLEYTEALTQSPQAGYGQCDQPNLPNQSNQFVRVGENFRVDVQDPFRDGITVNGQAIVFPTDQTDPANPKSFFINISKKTDPEDIPVLPLSSLPPSGPDNQVLPLDESVPYQELPSDDPTIPITARWLIPLGSVYWDGTSGKQQFGGDSLHPATKEDGRHYIGSVTSRLLTPARNLVVRDRNTDVPLPAFDPNKPLDPNKPSVPDGVVMTIEGTLQVDRLLNAQDDIQIHDHALDFRSIGDDSQTDAKKLYTISRIDGGGAGGIDLRFKIGMDNKGKNRFVVGTTVNNDLFTVNDMGNAYLAGSMDGLTITGILDFGSQPRQMITLWSSPDKKQQNGIGVQVSASSPNLATTYFRSSNDFYWFKGGAHSDQPGEPAGGQVQLSLDADGSLHFDKGSDADGRRRQMLNLSSTRYGIGVQDSTLYYRSDFDFCWFKGGSHSDNQSDPGGGTMLMKLDASGGLNVTGSLDVNGPLVVVGPSITFQSTTDHGFFVMLGQPRAGVHGSDSIFGFPNLWLDADGAVIVKQGLRMHGLNGAAFFTVGTLVPNQGDIVVINHADGTVIQSSSANDPSVVGVAMHLDSSVPGFILADQPNPQLETNIVVALMGIVLCNAIGAIQVGALLTTSSTAGHAQAAPPNPAPGTVFGKALDSQISGPGHIRVVLMPS